MSFDAMVHEIVSDGVVALRFDRDFELRADAVGARDEHRLRHVGRHAKHSAEAAELAARSGGERRQHVRLDAVLRVVGRIDVDAGACGSRSASLARVMQLLLERDEPVEVARRAR